MKMSVELVVTLLLKISHILALDFYSCKRAKLAIYHFSQKLLATYHFLQNKKQYTTFLKLEFIKLKFSV